MLLVRIAALALACLPLGASGTVRAQASDATNTVTPPASDYLAGPDGQPRTQLELVRDEDARGPTDLMVLAAGGAFPCHLPCRLEVPSGPLRLLGEGLDQQFDVELASARFRVRAGEPVPWLESIGAIAGGIACGIVGVYVATTTGAEDELAGAIALTTLGALLFGVGVAAIIVGVLQEHGTAELEGYETALREGLLRF